VLLHEVIANLLDNALKYVPPSRFDGGRITVTVSQNPSTMCAMAEIIVEDNGPGVPLVQQPICSSGFSAATARAKTASIAARASASPSFTTSWCCITAACITRTHRKAAHALSCGFRSFVPTRSATPRTARAKKIGAPGADRSVISQ
jgi:hypothetical protein